MSHIFKKAALAVALVGASLSANAAVEANITVWANVDPTLSLLKADGTALPDAVQLVYRAGGAGLAPWSEDVRIFSNDIEKDVSVRLAAETVLRPDLAAPGAINVPLTVSLNGRELDTTAIDFAADDLFDSAIPGASIAMPLRVQQTVSGEINFAGLYSGTVALVVAQNTAAP
ncbi:CS1 type fimbrial major subunit [Stenotrophomonas maltophilia]|uniref:Fimbrial protein n=1 Tax=Stenotrophomonas maltophilia TaxID=40324 RepID=A0A4S2D741_STEMA|nr:CS1 type fimbrial major subunit [Stenotrophomonas maltophilia]TGY37075.1 fimbrial protein [Stenotrophomonas maltophilia]